MVPLRENLSITGIENEKRIERAAGTPGLASTLDRYSSYQEDRLHEGQTSAFQNNNRCCQPCRSRPYRSHALGSAPYSGLPGVCCLVFNRHLWGHLRKHLARLPYLLRRRRLRSSQCAGLRVKNLYSGCMDSGQPPNNKKAILADDGRPFQLSRKHYSWSLPARFQLTMLPRVSSPHSFGSTIPVCFWYFPALSL